MGVSPREPLSNMSAALATTKIAIGPSVTNLVTRHPTVTANAMMALDELTDGRANLGIGAGWSAVYGAGGSPSKLKDIRRGLAEFRQLFTGEEVHLYDREVQLKTARRQLPIYLAASQPGMLKLCGETCDGAILMGAADADFCRWQLEFLGEGMADGGRQRDDVLVDLVVTMSVDDDREKATSDVRAWATSQAATFDVWKSMPPGWERFRSEFRATADRYHLVDHLSLAAEHKELVSDAFVHSVAIAGDEEYCIGRLRKLAELDVDRITFALLSGGRRRRLDQIAERIIPAVEGRA
jgi:5,10-methylenetetrahydromethanopterin reductase